MSMVYEIRRQLAGAMLYTRKPLMGARAGKFRVRTRGAGSDLDQLRDYQPGDDVRYIDWKSSARVQHLVMREYRDEQSRTIQLIVDRSRSMDFGLHARSMRDCAAEVAMALAVLAENGGDACGLFFAGDQLYQRVDPAVGAQQTERIAGLLVADNRALESERVSTVSRSRGNWGADLGAHNLRASVLFVLSDFIGPGFIDTFDLELIKHIRALAKKHLLVAIRVRDESERHPESVGRQWLLRDSELFGKAERYLRLETMADCELAAKKLFLWRHEQEQALLSAGFLSCDCFAGSSAAKSCDGSIVQQLCAGLRRLGIFTGRKR